MTESGPRNIRVGPAFVGLLVLLAFSLAAAWGRKPPKEEAVKVTLRPLSSSQVMDILQRFPQMVPSYLVEHKNDTAFLADIFPFSEVTAAPLARALPRVRFYTGVDFSYSDVDVPYMIAIAGGKRYWMPGEFDRLLFDKGMKITDNNIVKLAEALLVASIYSDHRSCPDIVFLGATRTKLVAWATDAAQLKVRIGSQTQVWHLDVLRNQFDGASSVDEEGHIKDYHVEMVESHPQR